MQSSSFTLCLANERWIVDTGVDLFLWPVRWTDPGIDPHLPALSKLASEGTGTFFRRSCWFQTSALWWKLLAMCRGSCRAQLGNREEPQQTRTAETWFFQTNNEALLAQPHYQLDLYLWMKSRWKDLHIWSVGCFFLLKTGNWSMGTLITEQTNNPKL